MRDDIILKLQRIIEGNDRITWDLFPEIYDGFLEADELSLAEDRMLQLVASAVQTATNDKIISTASAEKVAEYEDAFGLSASGLTLDERRQQVLDYINRSRVINETKLHELCQALAPGFTVYERTDPQALTLGVCTEEDAQDGTLPAVGIVDGIRPTVPQNLALYAGVDTAFNRPLVVSHAHFSALWAGLGTVERQIPRQIVLGGEVTSTSSTIIEMDTPERLELGTILFTGELRENVMPESGRSERGTISFTGELRENVMPESGVVEEWEQNSIEVLFGVYANRYTGEWLAYNIGMYSAERGCVLSQEDDDALHDFGLETTGFIGAYGTGPYGCVVWDDSYTFEPLALYTDITGTTLDTDDMSNFTCVKTNDWVGITMISQESGSNDHSTATMAWKCRITKNT